MKNLLFLISTLFLLTVNGGFSQEFKIGVLPIEIPNHDDFLKKKASKSIFSLGRSNDENYNHLLSAQNAIVNEFLSDSRFIVVDRTDIKYVDEELDRQKSESFMDGYVVGQGKQLGVDYLIRSFYNQASKALTIHVFSVSEGSSIGDILVRYKVNILGSTSFVKDIKIATAKLIGETWPFDIVLYEIIEGNNREIKKALIVSMAEVRIKKNDKLLMFLTTSQTIGGKEMTRDKVIGEAKVELKENSNFFIVNIKKGKKEAKEYFEKGEVVKFKLKE